ncbi:hypothetical protein [Enterobacter oligotrophicus]|uniref:hypothetical protein n=1 Tax=Enterobacter oligotrophicus TaxID=2478464 RepID=UPI000367506E|nr:hypothetical protein [Enterobacter oligotrophicus]
MLITIITFLLGLCGAVLISAGAWLLLPPAGLIVGGVFMIWISYLIASSAAPTAPAAGDD